MADRYKLLKDLPDAKAGTILTDNGSTVDYTATNGHSSWYKPEYVKEKKDWFQKIEENARKEEVDPSILHAIEILVDNDFIITKYNGKSGTTYGKEKVLNIKFYTEQDLIQARIDAFDAARVFLFTPKTPQEQDRIVEMAKFYIENLLKYKFAGDYLQSLNNK